MTVAETVPASRAQDVTLMEKVINGCPRQAGWVFVTGEPGIGKTWMTIRAASTATARGLMVLRGRASEFERTVPFGVLVHALDDYLGSLDPEQLRGLGGDRVGDLARVFPSLAAHDTGVETGAQDHLYRAYRAIRALLERLADPHGLMLIIDDLQWADRESTGLIAHLVRRLPNAPVLVVAAWRDGRISPDLAGLPVEGDPRGLVLRLGPLTHGEAAELLATVRGPRRRAELMRESGGNPFYLKELAQVADGWQQPSVGRDNLALRPVPMPIAMEIRRELAELSPPAVAIASAAAIVGESFDLAVVAAVTGMPDDQLLPAVDDLVRARLIVETAIPRQFTFRRPVLRRGIYHLTPPGRRIAAHARAAEQLGGRPADRAAHLARLAAPPDPGAVAVLVEAGREMLGTDPARALDFLGAARRLVPASDSPATRAEILIGYGDSAARAGELDEARRAYDEALPIIDPGHTKTHLRVLCQLAVLEQLTGHGPRSWERVRDALDGRTETGSAPSAALHLVAAAAAGAAGDPRSMLQHARQAVARAQGGGDQPALAIGHSLAGVAEVQQGAFGDARLSRRSARSIVANISDRTLSRHLEAALCLGYLELVLGDFAASVSVLTRLTATAARYRQGQWQAPAQVLLAQGLSLVGQLDAAAEMAEAAEEAAQIGGAPLLAAEALAIHAVVLVAAGDVSAAIGLADEAVSAAAGDDAVECSIEHQRAAVHLATGDTAACHRMLSLADRHLPAADPTSECMWLDMLTRAALAVGQSEQAAIWAQRAEKVAAASGLSLALGLAGRARAATYLADGAVAEALECAQAAHEAAARSGARVEAARIWLTEAAALARAGHRHQAVQVLRAAVEEFRACGAKRYEDEAGRELRRLGQRAPAPPSLSRPLGALPSLSRREWQVAELVAAGRTNRQIASILLLSNKTVETHLTRIFGKLDISSRASLARIVERHRTTAAFTESG
jgi:DNA-binding NarL/FixJ family response regulator